MLGRLHQTKEEAARVLEARSSGPTWFWAALSVTWAVGGTALAVVAWQAGAGRWAPPVLGVVSGLAALWAALIAWFSRRWRAWSLHLPEGHATSGRVLQATLIGDLPAGSARALLICRRPLRQRSRPGELHLQNQFPDHDDDITVELELGEVPERTTRFPVALQIPKGPNSGHSVRSTQPAARWDLLVSIGELRAEFELPVHADPDAPARSGPR